MHKVVDQVSFQPWDAAYASVQAAMMNERVSYQNILKNMHYEVLSKINAPAQAVQGVNEAIHSTN